MILQSYQNKLIWESESTAAQICQIWNTTPEADVHVIKTFSFLSRNGSKDSEYSCSLIPVSNTSLMQRVVTDLILRIPLNTALSTSLLSRVILEMCVGVSSDIFWVRMAKYFSLDDHLTFLLNSL